MKAFRLAGLGSALLFVLQGCSSSAEPIYEAPDRLPGDRSPLTAACDELDTLRCLLPWPSNSFTVADASTETGLRLAVQQTSLVMSEDDPEAANRANGFSRVTPLVTGFAASLAPVSTPGKDGPLRLFSLQKDASHYAQSVPLRMEIKTAEDFDGELESFVFGYPLRPLEANADYLAVVLDDWETTDGKELQRSRAVEVALGLVSPASEEEAKLRAYHAPSRALLAHVGIEPERVLRLWDFTTRSESDATARLLAMRDAAVDVARAGKVSVVIDEVVPEPAETIAAIVEGRLQGLPFYLDANKNLAVDAEGMPVAIGTHDAPFRIVIPAGEGDYPFVMYGHGTGGNFHDDIFDADLGEIGMGKVGIQFHGWTDTEVLGTFGGLGRVVSGSSRAVAPLMQAMADGAAIQASLDGVLGDSVGAPLLRDVPNPAAGRRPDSTLQMWVGGSLGGTMSLVAVGALPGVDRAVINVPGAAWSHFIPSSHVFGPIRVILRNSYGSDLDTLHAVSMSQGIWDEIDGASFASAIAEKSAVLLVQESMGDPVLPNPGSEMAAVVAAATHIGKVLSPIEGLSSADEAVEKSGITQYRVPDTGPFDVHGFASSNTPAGAAAREQIRDFLQSVRAQAPRIVVPSGCKDGSCDFVEP